MSFFSCVVVNVIKLDSKYKLLGELNWYKKDASEPFILIMESSDKEFNYELQTNMIWLDSYDANWSFDMIKIQSNYAWEQIVGKNNM